MRPTAADSRTKIFITLDTERRNNPLFENLMDMFVILDSYSFPHVVRKIVKALELIIRCLMIKFLLFAVNIKEGREKFLFFLSLNKIKMCIVI